jgi:hydrogenase expression/formation protein HypE
MPTSKKRGRLHPVSLRVSVAHEDAEPALDLMRSHPAGEGASFVGGVVETGAPLATRKSRIGTSRILDMFGGEQLPRIC